MRKTTRLASVAAATALLATTLIGAQAPDASAARMIDWHHSGASQRGSATVYSGWACGGTADSVPRGTESEIDPASAQLYKGYSFWRVKTDGTKVKIAPAKSRNTCLSYVGYNRVRDGYWAHRLGNNWDAG